MESMFTHFISQIIPRYVYEGVEFQHTSVINDDNISYVDCIISITRVYNDVPIIWATLKLRLMYNEHNNLWSVVKIWEFLVDPYENTINTYRMNVVRNVEYMEALSNIINIMDSDIVEMADRDSYTHDLDYNWPVYYLNSFNIENQQIA